MQNLDIDIAWTLAEAYARTGDLAQASTVYRTLLTEQTDAGLRLATVQKAMAAMPIASVEPLLTLGSRGADGADEFRAIRPDVTRARMVAVLHGEPAGRIEPAELAAVGEQARRLGNPSQIALLGWYAYHRRQFREALDWFKLAQSRGGDAAVATGLALSLREMGQTREAEDIVFAWRAASVTNLALYVDIMERSLGESSGAAVEPERLDRFAKVVLATGSAEGAPAPDVLRRRDRPVSDRGAGFRHDRGLFQITSHACASARSGCRRWCADRNAPGCRPRAHPCAAARSCR